jgi:hypothetical protein
MGAPAALADTSDSPVTDSCLTSSSLFRFEDGLSVFVPLDFFERVRPVFAGPTDWATVLSTGSGTILSASLDSLASASASNVSAVLSRSLATEASLCESSTPVTDSSSSSPSALLRRDASVLSDVRGAIEFYLQAARTCPIAQGRGTCGCGQRVCWSRWMSRSECSKGSEQRQIAIWQTLKRSTYRMLRPGMDRVSRWNDSGTLSMSLNCQVLYSGANGPKLLPRTRRPAAKHFAFGTCTAKSLLFYIKTIRYTIILVQLVITS